MDTKRTSQPKPAIKRYWYLPVISLIALAIYLSKQFLGDASYFVARDKLQMANVQHGDFKIEVRGSGVLKPKSLQWSAAQSRGRVQQLLAKPGDSVVQGQKIAELENVELLSELEKIQWELKAIKAENNAAAVAQQAQQLDLENAVMEAEFNYKSSKLKLDAEQSLLDQGKGSLSALDFKRTQLAVKQQYARWQAQIKRADKMQQNYQASELARQARLEQVENNLRKAQQQVSGLTITAGISGIVQKLPIELGQQLNSGENAALVIDPASLFAEINIQEIQVKDVVMGQPVTIDTRFNKLSGEVQRISPLSENGLVAVEVGIISELPKEARSDLNIDGYIEVTNIKNTLYVKRPAFAPKNRTVDLFKTTSDGAFAQKHEVKLGTSTAKYIQILSGLNPGDQIIISDTSAWASHSSVKIQ